MSKPRRVFLIVLYNQKLSESVTFRTLYSQLTDVDKLIVYDNSPKSMLDVAASNFVYIHDATNGGLVTAYNFAVERSRKSGDQWLTIFDQDTEIPDDFIHKMNLAVDVFQDSAVLIPSVKLGDGTLLSPFWIEDALFIGYPKKKSKTLAAINSGVTLNLPKFSTETTLFDERYPLDFLDFVFFKQLQSTGKVARQIDTTLKQALSLSNFREMSQKRFESFQLSEARFVAEFYPQFKNRYRLRVALRFIKQLVKRIQYSKLRVMLQVIGGRNLS